MKKLFIVLTVLISLLFPANIQGENLRINDNVGILSESDINDLTIELDGLSAKYDYDIVVYFSNDTSFGEDIVSEGSEFFDLNGYGCGDDHRGLLLIVNYETGYFDIITTGDEVRNKYDGYLEYGCETIGPYLRDNPVYAIRLFEEWIDTRFINDNYQDVIIDEPISKEELSKQRTIRDLSISGLVAVVITTITMLILKGQLKTEGKKRGAHQYVVPHSFNLTRSGDIFLYRTTSRRYIPKKTNNNHGNGFHVSHTSSSGISHGSSGGHKF